MADPITLFVTSLGAGAGKAGVQEATKALRDIAGIQDAQLALLASIDHKVDLLIQGPFHAGRQKLEDAAQPGRDPEDRLHLLREARTFFDVSMSQDPDPLRRSLAALHLACVWTALGSQEDVRKRLEAAHTEAVLAMVAEKHRRPGGLSGLRGRISPSARLTDNSLRWGAAIRSVGPYVNALARTARQWGTPPERVPLFLGGGSEEPDRPAQEAFWQDVAARYAAERSWLASGGTLPARLDLSVYGVREDPDTRPGYEQARRMVERGEVMLWKDLAEFAEGDDVRTELGYWGVLRRAAAGRG
jgi:hypothetical protein